MSFRSFLPPKDVESLTIQQLCRQPSVLPEKSAPISDFLSHPTASKKDYTITISDKRKKYLDRITKSVIRTEDVYRSLLTVSEFVKRRYIRRLAVDLEAHVGYIKAGHCRILHLDYSTAFAAATAIMVYDHGLVVSNGTSLEVSIMHKSDLHFLQGSLFLVDDLEKFVVNGCPERGPFDLVIASQRLSENGIIRSQMTSNAIYVNNDEGFLFSEQTGRILGDDCVRLFEPKIIDKPIPSLHKLLITRLKMRQVITCQLTVDILSFVDFTAFYRKWDDPYCSFEDAAVYLDRCLRIIVSSDRVLNMYMGEEDIYLTICLSCFLSRNGQVVSLHNSQANDVIRINGFDDLIQSQRLVMTSREIAIDTLPYDVVFGTKDNDLPVSKLTRFGGLFYDYKCDTVNVRRQEQQTSDLKQQ